MNSHLIHFWMLMGMIKWLTFKDSQLMPPMMNTVFITIIIFYYTFLLKFQWTAQFILAFSHSAVIYSFIAILSLQSRLTDCRASCELERRDHNVSFQVWLHSHLQSMEQIQFQQMNMEKTYIWKELDWVFPISSPLIPKKQNPVNLQNKCELNYRLWSWWNSLISYFSCVCLGKKNKNSLLKSVYSDTSP